MTASTSRNLKGQWQAPRLEVLTVAQTASGEPAAVEVEEVLALVSA